MTSKDKKMLTDKSREVRHVKNLLKDIPNERVAKVGALRVEIKEGCYKVDVEAVAGKIIERTIKDSTKKNKS